MATTEYVPTVCVDFNGVLDTYTGWRGGEMYPPREGVGDFLFRLMQAGYRVVILTTMDEERVWLWLRTYEIDGMVDEVTNEKPPAVAYVDDRAVCFRGDFEATLAEVQSFKAHWETA